MWFWLNTEHDFNIHSHIFCRQCSNCQFQLSKAKGSPYVLVSKALRWILECQRLWLAASFHVFVGVDSAELPLIKARLFFSCHCCEEQWRWWADPCPSHTVALGKERCLLPFLASERLPHVYGTGFRSRLSTAHIFFVVICIPIPQWDLRANRLASSTGPQEISHPTAWFASINQIYLDMQTEQSLKTHEQSLKTTYSSAQPGVRWQPKAQSAQLCFQALICLSWWPWVLSMQVGLERRMLPHSL